MRGPDDLHFEFCTRVEKWIPVRKETIHKIKGIINDLKKHHRNVNISRITGSSVSFTGSLIAILGFGLAPVTLGASIGLSTAGIAMAVAGGGAAAGASIVHTVLQKLNVKQAQEHLKEDYDQLYTIKVIAKVIDSNTVHVVATDMGKECPGVDNNGVVGEVLAQGLLRAGNVSVRTAEIAAANTLEIGAAALRVGGKVAKSIAVAGLVLNVALIPIDLLEIVRSSISLAKGSQTKAVKQLKEIVKQLKQQPMELRSAIYQQTQNGERDQAGMGSGMRPSTGTGTVPSTATEMGPDTGTETGSSTGPGMGLGAVPGTETEIGPEAGPGTETGTELGQGTGTPEMGMGPGTEPGPGTGSGTG